MQRVQVPTSSLRRKKYSIPGLSCVLIKITSFKTPFELSSDQCRRWISRRAGGCHGLTWCSPHTHWSDWALQVCTAHVLHICCRNSAQTLDLSNGAFFWQTNQRVLAPDLFLLKSIGCEPHRAGHFRNPSHSSSHSSTLMQDYSCRSE